ncbi:MAG: hypothetical protein AB8B56_04960 [Crocinitomicaceae bacterium]
MKLLLSILCLFSLHSLTAQNERKIESLLNQERTEIEKVELDPTTIGSANSVTLLPSSFAQNEVEFQKSIEQLRELTIVKVYYVYTKYRKSPGFNQKALDKKRFKQLNASFPEIIESTYVDWEIVEQTGCTSPEMGRSFFHGFVFVHRPIQSEAERLAEIERLEEYMKNPTDVFLQPNIDILEEQLNPKTSSTVEIIPDQDAIYSGGPDAMLSFLKKELRTDEIALKRDDQWVKTHIKIDENGVISDLTFLDEQPERIKNAVEGAIFAMPNWEPAYKDSVPVTSELDLEVRVSYSPSTNGMYLINGDRPSLTQVKLEEKPNDLTEYGGSSSQEIFMKAMPVFKGLQVMDRSERSALVMDVTGSMSENVATMKRWINSNQDSLNFTSFTFFNDGDDRPTRKKKIGSTGGIYTTFRLSNMDALVTQTMRKGSGGERPESDIEALLHTQEKDTLCDVILLIGDNYSEVRDLELLPKLNKRVNVLVCSLKGSIRPDYLLIAKNTSGYLLYNGERIDLQSVRKGDILSMGSYQYDYIGKVFKFRDTLQSETRM